MVLLCHRTDTFTNREASESSSSTPCPLHFTMKENRLSLKSQFYEAMNVSASQMTSLMDSYI